MKTIQKKWCILRTPENAKVINDNVVRLYFDYNGVIGTNDYNYVHVNNKDKWISVASSPMFLYTPITFEQFCEWFVNPKERKIIGYKFKEGFESYEKVVCDIIIALHPIYDYTTLEQYNGVDKEKGIVFESNSGIERDMKKAGVLDVWFDAVYKEEEKPISFPKGKLLVDSDYGFKEMNITDAPKSEISLVDEPAYKTLCAMLAENLGYKYLELTGHWIDDLNGLYQATERGLQRIGTYNVNVGSHKQE